MALALQVLEECFRMLVGDVFGCFLTRAGRFLYNLDLDGVGGGEVRSFGRCLSNDR